MGEDGLLVVECDVVVDVIVVVFGDVGFVVVVVALVLVHSKQRIEWILLLRFWCRLLLVLQFELVGEGVGVTGVARADAVSGPAAAKGPLRPPSCEERGPSAPSRRLLSARGIGPLSAVLR